MFFRKKEIKKTFDEEYFLYRDSLTGCMNETFAAKEFKKCKGNINCGGIMIRLCNAENMFFAEGEELILETAVTVSSIYKGNISRTRCGDFVIFTEDFKNVADKINRFLYELSDENRHYAVGAEGFDRNEGDYSSYMGRLKRAVAAAELSGGKKAIY